MFYLETWKKFTTSITGGTLISFSDVSPLSRSCRELKPKRPLGHALWVENISSSLSQGRISSQRAHRPSSSSVGYAQGKCSQQRVGESYRQAACGQWVSMTIEDSLPLLLLPVLQDQQKPVFTPPPKCAHLALRGRHQKHQSHTT